jgi:hypothetical protein
MEITLKDYIKKTLEEINAGLPVGYVIEDTIDFEVSISTSINKKGGVEIKVLTGSIASENESVQTVCFSVINESDKKKSFDQSAKRLLNYAEKGIKRLSKLSEQQKGSKI